MPIPVGLAFAMSYALHFGAREPEPVERRFEYSRVSMGVRVNVTLYAQDEALAERAAVAAFERFDALEAIFSDYRPDSEAMKLCDRAIEAPVAASEDLVRVLRRSLELAKRSDGAFDPTVGPLVRLWREARKTGRLPGAAAIEAARAQTGWQYVRVDGNRVSIAKRGLRLDFGGVAKGDACDQALAAITERGVRRAMVEAGGDIALSDPPPGTKGWRIAILGRDGPPEVLANTAISTSGDAAQFVEIDGVRYSHIVDPRTGIGMTNRLQATVIAPRGLTTDPLATAVCVLGEEAGSALARREGVRLILVRPKTTVKNR
ncbi:MAG: FAD:protein FMN transferase [Fimbriimonadaceae bacterium]|nr:FAD:protein FMN transferase [Fimbriimonadaceae bacterium]